MLIGSHMIGHKVLMLCGIFSSLLYVAMNVVVPMQWKHSKPDSASTPS